MKKVKPLDVQVGEVIDYRGVPATVIAVWRPPMAPEGGFFEPVGIEIEFIDVVGTRARVRLLWPALESESRRQVRAYVKEHGELPEGIQEEFLKQIDSFLTVLSK